MREKKQGKCTKMSNKKFVDANTKFAKANGAYA